MCPIRKRGQRSRLLRDQVSAGIVGGELLGADLTVGDDLHVLLAEDAVLVVLVVRRRLIGPAHGGADFCERAHLAVGVVRDVAVDHDQTGGGRLGVGRRGQHTVQVRLHERDAVAIPHGERTGRGDKRLRVGRGCHNGRGQHSCGTDSQRERHPAHCIPGNHPACPSG